MTPQQRHSADAADICLQRSIVYEQARDRHPLRRTGASLCWRQPEVVWINPPPDDVVAQTASLAVTA